jgi:hypothetical protein
LKCAGKLIPRSARNGLSGRTKALNPRNPERIITKNVKNKRQKKLRRKKEPTKEV